MEKKLQRNNQDKMLAGVCSGLAEYFDVEVTWVRIAFVVAVLAGFSGVLAYIVLWIAVPARPFDPNHMAYSADYRVTDHSFRQEAPGFTDGTPAMVPVQKKKGEGRIIIGILLILFGTFFLLDEYNLVPYWFDFGKLWPMVIIIPGILLIARSAKKPPYNSGSSYEERIPVSDDDLTKPAADEPVI